MSPHLRLLIADHHTLFRSGLVEMLSTISEVRIVGTAAHGDEVIRLAAEVYPDVVLLDAEMPGPGVEETLRRLAASSAARVVILTMYDDPELVRCTLRLGATGYLSKIADRRQLVAVLFAAHDTVFLALPQSTVRHLLEGPEARQYSLTRRETEVLQLVEQGLTNHQIGGLLNISETTAKRHLTNIYSKLEVFSRVAAVRRATSLGIIGTPGARPWHGNRPSPVRE